MLPVTPSVSVHHHRASASPQLQCLEAHPACAVAGPSNNPPRPPIKGDFEHQYYFQPCFCWDFARWCWGARSWLGVFCSPVHVHGICSVWIVQSVFLHSTEMVFFSFSFFFFFNLKVSRGEPLSPVPSLYPPPLQPPVAAVTSLVPGQRDPAPAWPFASSLPFGCTLFTCFAQPCSSAHWPVLQVQGCGVCSPGLCPLLQHPGAELGPPALLLRAAAGPGCAPGLCGQPGAPWCQPGLCWATACSSARLPLHLLSIRGCSEGLSPRPCMRLWG